MRITNYEVYTCRPGGQNYVTLRIVTQDGTFGLGDATLAGRELAVVAYLEKHLLPTLIGREAFDIEHLWHYMYQGAYWRGGPVAMTAIGAVDTALWDIKGKALDTPVFNLLGGRSRHGVRAYGHAWGKSIDDAVSAARRRVDEGFTAVRFSSSIESLPGAYRELNLSEAPDADSAIRPPEELWDFQPYYEHLPKLVRKLRSELGPHIDLIHDTHHRLTATEANRLAARLEEFDLFWLEDPIRPALPDVYRVLRNRSSIPLAIGETFHDLTDCYPFIIQQLADYLRIAPSHAGGITNLRKIAALADPHRISMACHGPIDVSPIGLSAAIHFGINVHNFSLQEYVPHAPETEEVFSRSYVFESGSLRPAAIPGLGVDFNVELAQRFPYEPSYLPVVRRPDGTIHDW